MEWNGLEGLTNFDSSRINKVNDGITFVFVLGIMSFAFRFCYLESWIVWLIEDIGNRPLHGYLSHRCRLQRRFVTQN
jgi:hypothetical protein